MSSNTQNNFSFDENESYPLGYKLNIEEEKIYKPTFPHSISQAKTDSDDIRFETTEEGKICKDTDYSAHDWSKLASIIIKDDKIEKEESNDNYSISDYIIAPINDKIHPYKNIKQEENNCDEFDSYGNNISINKFQPCEIKQNNNDDFGFDWTKIPSFKIDIKKNEVVSIANSNPNNSNKEIISGNQSKIPLKEKKEEKRRDIRISPDNLMRKCKHIILDDYLIFVNNRICNVYNNDIGKGILEKRLKSLNKKQRSESNAIFNKEFLHKTMAEIFSEDICKRMSNFPSDHNKKLIKRLLNEEDPFKRKYFNELFSLTFLQCLNHYIGKEFYLILDGMSTLQEQLKQFSEENDYSKNLKYYFENYEKIILEKKSRKRRKQSKKKNSIGINQS